MRSPNILKADFDFLLIFARSNANHHVMALVVMCNYQPIRKYKPPTHKPNSNSNTSVGTLH